MISFQDEIFICGYAKILQNISNKYKIGEAELELSSIESVEDVKRFVILNADVLKVPIVELCVLEDEDFEQRYGGVLSVYEFNNSESKSEQIYLRRSCLDNTIDCFLNIAHEMRHHYQKMQYKEFFDKNYDYMFEIDANAYAKLIGFYFTGVWTEVMDISEHSEPYSGKTIEDINLDTMININDIRRDIQTNILTLVI